MHSYLHAQVSARKWGGTPEDYLPIHEWIDQFKQTVGDVRHRAFLHNTKGPFLAEQIFGKYIEIPKQTQGVKKIMVRDVVENHIFEDLGWLPSPADFSKCMTCETWFGGRQEKIVSKNNFLKEEE